MHSIPRLPFPASGGLLHHEFPFPEMYVVALVIPDELTGADAADGIVGQLPQNSTRCTVNLKARSI